MRGNGRVFQRGQIWWVAYYHEGREHRESSKLRERKDAITLLRQRIEDIAAGTLPRLPASTRTDRTPITMHDLLDLLEHNYKLNNRLSKTAATYLKRLRKRFARYTVQTCTGLAISHYMAAMQRAGRKALSINREIAVLRSASDSDTDMISWPGYRPSGSCRSTRYATSFSPAGNLMRCLRTCPATSATWSCSDS